MTTTEAVRDRILHLCEERGLTINRLATICALRQTAGVFIFTYRSRLRSPPAAPPYRSPSPRKTG